MAAAAAAAIDRLRDRDDGRSQLLVYQYLLLDDQLEAAEEWLFASADQAVDRLRAARNSSDSVDGRGTETAVWDYSLVLRAATTLLSEQSVPADIDPTSETPVTPETSPAAVDSDPSEGRLARAGEYYEALIASDAAEVSASFLEQAYVGAGQVEAARGNVEKGVEIWRQGLEKANSDSLALLQAIAATELAIGSVDDARLAVNEFSAGLERAALQLSKSNAQTISIEQRDAIDRRHDAARWDLLVMRATVAERAGERKQAVSLLERAVESQSGVSSERRIAATRQLAALYSALGYWDMAASTLEQAVRLAPDDPALRAAAGQAWSRAGNRRQAAQQWRVADSGGTIGALLAAAQAEFNNQIRMPASERSFSRTLSVIRRGQQALDDLPQPEPDSDQAEAVRNARWRLKALEISVPEGDATSEAHARSARYLDALAGLAKEFEDQGEAQLYAAQRFLAADEIDAAKDCRQRIAAIAGEEHDAVVMADAMILREEGKPDEAFKVLIDRAAVENGENRIELRRLASDFALNAGDVEKAYETLAAATNSDVESAEAISLYSRLAEIARRLPADAATFNRSATANGPDALAASWESRLREVEGDGGTVWRYQRATRQLANLLRESGGDPAAAELGEVKRLTREILYRRSNWGPAIAVDGRLRALEGQNREAIRRLQEAIDAGDTSLQTRQWLALSLIRDGRNREAMTVLDSIGSETISGSGNLSRMAVAINAAQGDYRRGLQFARQSASANPNDVAMRVMLANHISVLLRNEPNADDRGELIEEAYRSLDQAQKIAGGRQPSIYLSRFRFEELHGDDQGQLAVIDSVDESNLSDLDRWKLLGQFRRSRGEWAEAEEALKKAQRLEPDSVEIQLALSEVYRQTDRQESLVSSLERAHDLNPRSDQIRSQLALALALESGADIPWDRVEQLLDDGNIDGESSQLLYALMLGARGDDTQREEARQILRRIADGQGERRTEATRALAGLHRLQWQQSDEPMGNEEALQNLADAKTLLESLASPNDAAATDLYRYADLLLVEAQLVAADELERLSGLSDTEPVAENAVEQAKQELRDKTADLVRQAGTIRDRLRGHSAGTVYALDVALRKNQLEGRPTPVDQLIGGWADQALAGGQAEPTQILSTAGSSLLRFGFAENALDWLRRAYETDPGAFANYVLALNRSGDAEAAVDVCLDRFEEKSDAQAAILLAESLIAKRDVASRISDRADRALETAIGKFPSNPAVLESVATLRLQQQQIDKALKLYQVVEKISPDRLRTLNNLAMIYSELPGQAAKGLPRINKAIEIAGESPELLDTKGVVLLRAGQLDEAETTFREALEQVDEPRFRFHLVLTLRAAKRDQIARQEWSKLDLKNLDRTGITQNEREELDRIIREYNDRT